MSTNENVLVIPARSIPGLDSMAGFNGDVPRSATDILMSKDLQFMPREKAETNEDFKQIIPYILVRYMTEKISPSYFSYVRGKAQGEARLHSKVSIGIGGHVNDRDHADPSQSFALGMMRELTEELSISTALLNPMIVGSVYDPATPVGRVHYGIVMVLDVPSMETVTNNDAHAEDSIFQSVAQLRQNDRLEAWSRMCVQGLHPYKFN